MKKCLLLLFCVFFSAASPLFALRPGDVADGSVGKLHWINTLPIKLGKLTKEERAVAPELRAAVFFLTRNRASDYAVTALESCRRNHFRRLQIAMISPDPAADVEAFAARHRATRLRFAVDTRRDITPYFMAGNALFPLGFLMDRDGVILWCGEAVDMPEAVERYFAGTLDVKAEKELAQLTDELHLRLRAGENRAMQRCAAKIFKLRPGHPTALRITLFALENAGDISAAWQLVREQIAAAPQILRLYFTAFDLIRRHRTLLPHLPEIAKGFNANVKTPAERLALAAYLMQNFPENPDVVLITHPLLVGKYDYRTLQDGEKAQLALLRAKTFHLTGSLNAALKYALEAEAAFKTLNNSQGAAYAANLVKYYRTLLGLKRIIY